eukprot:Rhum_TRINITY_DN14390_c13_g1::Rhum_TRINITY_DN14390_c13_g1_i1::g.85751::m.85751
MPRVSAGVLAAEVGKYAVSAVGMTAGNKLAVEYLRSPSSGRSAPTALVAAQMFGTLLLLLTLARSHVPRRQLTVRHAASWAVVFATSGAGILTSAEAFVHASVSFVVVVRNAGTLLTTATEYAVRGVTVTRWMLAAELLILAGMCLYGHAMATFDSFWPALGYCLLNTACITAWSVMLKHKTQSDPEIKEMNKYTMALYNNAMGLLAFTALSYARGEFEVLAEVVPGLPLEGWLAVAVTCGIGYVISTSGFALNRLVSATSYQVVANLCKVGNILFGVAVLGDAFPGAGSVAGCVLALGAGAWYAYLQTPPKGEEPTAEGDTKKLR